MREEPSKSPAAPVPPDTGGEGRSSFGLLLLCFFLSGVAALVYQTAWMRQFAFVFGTSELAVASVLAAYMGDVECVEALLTIGADANYVNHSGCTALMNAVRC